MFKFLIPDKSDYRVYPYMFVNNILLAFARSIFVRFIIIEFPNDKSTKHASPEGFKLNGSISKFNQIKIIKAYKTLQTQNWFGQISMNTGMIEHTKNYFSDNGISVGLNRDFPFAQNFKWKPLEHLIDFT